MSEVKALKTESATQAFYREIEELKPRLPKDWKLRFLKKHPDYDSYRGGVVLHNVINQRSTDPVVMAGLLEIASEYAKELQTNKNP